MIVGALPKAAIGKIQTFVRREQMTSKAAIDAENNLTRLGPWVTIVQGAILMLCVLAFRRGIVGELGNG